VPKLQKVSAPTDRRRYAPRLVQVDLSWQTVINPIDSTGRRVSHLVPQGEGDGGVAGEFIVASQHFRCSGVALAQLFERLDIVFGEPRFRASRHHCADWSSVPSASCWQANLIVIIPPLSAKAPAAWRYSPQSAAPRYYFKVKVTPTMRSVHSVIQLNLLAEGADVMTGGEITQVMALSACVSAFISLLVLAAFR
jgi:hypothetical protein